MGLDERSIVRTRTVDFRERESARLFARFFGKWKGDEGERELWELGGGSLKWK